MKILLGYPWFPSEAYGNVQKMELERIGRLQAAGYNVDGFCLTINPPASHLTFPQLDALWKKRNRNLLMFYDNLLQKLDGYDVLINAAGINLHPEFVEMLPVVTVFGCNDDPESSDLMSKPVLKSYDLCLVGNIAEVESYYQWGAKHAVWHPMGFQGYYSPQLTYEDILSGERDIDIFMMAERASKWRRERFDILERAFPEGFFFGAGWKRGYLPTGNEISWLQRTKICPNIHNSTGPINFRTFYLPANGVLQICDNKKHLAKIYELGKEAVGFNTIEECVDLCRYYLAHDEERRYIAANGWKRVTNDYTEEKIFERAVQAIAPILEKKKPIPKTVSTISLFSRNRIVRFYCKLYDSLFHSISISQIKALLIKKIPNVYACIRRIWHKSNKILNSKKMNKQVKTEKSNSLPSPIGPTGIRIICYEDVDAWILGKFAKQLCGNLISFGRKADIAKIGDTTASIGHHIIYYDAKEKWAAIETFMITHLDTDWKIEKVRHQLELYDMGICMSKETRTKLITMGMPASRLCYINPAQDGVIKPRPLVVGIASKIHSDKRKNEDSIIDVFLQLPKDGFILKIMGMGWEDHVQKLKDADYSVVYFEKFNYEDYVSSFMPSLDYFIYFSYDEGSMAFLDAIAADAKTIVTPQGFHLDIPGGIDYSINNLADIIPILTQIYEDRIARTSRVSAYNWQEYTRRHILVWDYLLTQKSESYKKQWYNFCKHLGDKGKENLASAFDAFSLPSIEIYNESITEASLSDFSDVVIQLDRGKRIYYPST
jgi:glycosyltransferase involved in cell wall biosynthesis